MITLRPFRPDDAPALLALFRDTIRRVNCRDYSPEQIAAWASDDIDPVRWSERFIGRFVPVAEEDGRPVGFAELEANGHIDRVYVSADHQRRGVGRMVIGAILDEARRRGLARLFTEASITARPFFEAHGFTVLAPQVVTVRGVDFVNFRMEWLAENAVEATRDGYTIFTDPRRLDLGAVHRFLATSYWSPGLPFDVLTRAVAGSICFGLYRGSEQVGFARVITDRATFAYLCDVYVLEAHRGRGLGRWLMEAVAAHPSLQGLRRFALVTRDAHGLYEQFGFKPLARPEGYMEIHRPDIYTQAE